MPPLAGGLVTLENYGDAFIYSSGHHSPGCPIKTHLDDELMAPSGVYHSLGVRAIINAAGTLTRLSGSVMAPETTAAMVEASGSFVRIDELQAAASRKIAEHTSAEAALVTAGAAAGLTLAAAACIARLDFAAMDLLPATEGMASEIIVPRSHRNGYDHALRAAGARLIEVGIAERTRDPQAWEIEAAIGPRTVALYFGVGFSPLCLDLVIEIAHRNELPVIVDAAAALPPKRNLRTFIEAGADLVCFSGGKAIAGPQATGILCGRRELIASAALQSWDLDVLPESWNPPSILIDASVAARGVPNHGIGRAMKVGKEQIVGLLVALDRFVEQDEHEQLNRLATVAKYIHRELQGLSGLEARLVERDEQWPVVELRINPDVAGTTALELVHTLQRAEPAIYLIEGCAREGVSGIDPFCLQAGEAEQVVAEIRRAWISLR